MQAMSRICAPCRLSPRCFLHASSVTCLYSADSSNTSLSKPPSPHQEMDFAKATDILFSEEEPKRKKKFGWDFHLWQAFVACLPSVAVYLTAQYARHEMRRMEAEREKEMAEKSKIEEEKQEQEAENVPGFQILKDRLDKMEEKISKIESIAVQTITAAKEEIHTDKVKKHVDNVKVGESDTSVQESKDAISSGNVVQKIPVKEETKETTKDPMKAHERDSK